MGKRGTNQVEVAQRRRPGRVDRLLGRPPQARPASTRPRPSASAPSGSSSRIRAGIPYRWSATRPDDRASPTRAAASPPSTRSAAPTAPRPPSASPSRWTSSSRRHQRRDLAPARARTTSTSSHGEGHGRILELVEEPDLPQGTLDASARARSTTTRSTSAPPRTSCACKDYIVGLGYTDVSDVKDRGYFFSVYLRTPRRRAVRARLLARRRAS